MKHVFEYLDEAFKEMFEERAAIREFDAGMTREEAEKQSMEDVEKLREKKGAQ